MADYVSHFQIALILRLPWVKSICNMTYKLYHPRVYREVYRLPDGHVQAFKKQAIDLFPHYEAKVWNKPFHSVVTHYTFCTHSYQFTLHASKPGVIGTYTYTCPV